MISRTPSLSAALRATVLALAISAIGCHSRNAAERAAEPILEKNAAARGGVKAWRAVESMSVSGTLDAGTPRDPVKLAMAYLRQARQTRAEARIALARAREAEPPKPVQLPFVMELKRPHKARVEVRFRGETAVQVYDGRSGSKLRPFLGRREVEPFTAEELRVASQQSELDGPLLDAAATGGKVELEGEEPVDGRDAYRLKVTAGDGQVRHVWVDAQTFLDVKVEGTRRVDGRPRSVWTSFRDYRTVAGLLIPHVLETAVEGVKGSEKIVLDRVVLNPRLDDARFTNPG
ncbi:LolA-like protein [Anaeromyxobacter oryzae]|uniref:Lipoprotein n=1 Tax=Anaeromyxobacter oryzae TaxID=2918170 RepID=A0ABN6MMY8_9BACT|nr:hypothetical protein [Anaeromyxobacter oryzae]BDG02336.1 hypothetical protein AMOR_13320 [Anaeromyxobacter oryzae]